MGHSADVLDMPVDPNEPTYCLCHQVSYGEMIGCDNPDVNNRIFNNQSYFILKMIVDISVPHRMVPFCLRRTYDKTKRKMVLSEMFS